MVNNWNITRKNKYLIEISALLGERLSGANFDSLSADFLDLPPIPETVPMKKTSEKEEPSSDDEEKEDENAFEILASEPSNSSTSA